MSADVRDQLVDGLVLDDVAELDDLDGGVAADGGVEVVADEVGDHEVFGGFFGGGEDGGGVGEGGGG